MWMDLSHTLLRCSGCREWQGSPRLLQSGGTRRNRRSLTGQNSETDDHLGGGSRHEGRAGLGVSHTSWYVICSDMSYVLTHTQTWTTFVSGTVLCRGDRFKGHERYGVVSLRIQKSQKIRGGKVGRKTVKDSLFKQSVRGITVGVLWKSTGFRVE